MTLQQYGYRPYHNHITIFQLQRTYSGYAAPYCGWNDDLTEDIDIHKLTIYPAGMFVEPFVIELANKLKNTLKKPIKSTPDGLCVYPVL